MRTVLFALFGGLILALAVGPLCAVALAQSETESAGETTEPPGLSDLPSAEEVQKRAEEAVTRSGEYANKLLGELCENRTLGWLAAAVALVLGLVQLLFGWALLRSVFVPFSALIGLATGAGITGAIVLNAMGASAPSAKWALLIVGAVGGTALYTLVAARARPIASMLIAAAPFLVAAAFLLPMGGIGALLAVGAGVLALAFGFGSILKLRPLAVLSTSLLGAVLLAALWGLLGHLLGSSLLRKSVSWALLHPLVLAVAVLCLALAGASFQLNLGPREPNETILQKRLRRLT